MAADLGRIKSTTASKHDAFVASQLAQAEMRIRVLDLTAGLLGLAALGLAYVLGMVLCDNWLLLSQHTRQLALYVFLAGAAGYLFFAVLRPLRLRVNPYYAARQVEQQLPQAKNSIVNWVDLHEQPLPPAIRGALGQRAAKDLAHVDLDRAISGRRTAWMGGAAGLFAAAFFAAFFLLGPAPFLSLLKRTFNPFEAVGVSTRTRLTLLKPEGGNATVTVGRGVNFVVDVNGKVPDPKAADAVKLLYRYEEGDPWLERRLIQEPSGEWTASLSAIEVKNGFWYRITGGDAATEEYRISVRAAPAITDFLATYHFRPYVARADEIRRERELKALRGTEVRLRIRTNRTLREGRLEFEGNGRAGGVKPLVSSVRGEVSPNEQHTLLVRFVVDEDGKYRLYFTSTDGEAYSDPVSCPVTAIPDQPPTVELTKPGRDIRLPADALLHLEGKAGDDIGVKKLVLRMRVIGGDKLRSQPYRSDEQLRLADGGYPRELEYKDFVELSRVKDENGQAYPLRAGMELEYWLEASDACDYPQANVAESKHYRVLLTEPEKNDPKKQQEKKQAEKDKKQHEQKQDQQLQKENQERRQQRQEQEARNKEEENKSKDAGKNASPDNSQPKEGDQTNNSEGKENNGQQGANKDGRGEPNNEEQKNELSKEDQKIEEKIQKALERKEAGENGKSESKPDKGDADKDKEAQQAKSEGGSASGDKSKSESKSAEKQEARQAGEGKDKGQPQAGKELSQDDGKGKPQPKGQDQGSAKDNSKSADGNRGESKDRGDRKDNGKNEKKQGGSAPKGEPSDQSEAKPDTGKSEPRTSASDENKPDDGVPKRKATDKEIEDLARALQSKDARQREKAKQQLQRLAKEAADAETREKAGEALKKMGEPDGPADNGKPKKDNSPTGKPSGERKEGEKSDGPKGSGSSGEKSEDKDAGSGQKNGQGNKKGQNPSSRGAEPKSPGSQGGDTPGGGSDRRSGDGGDQGAASSPHRSDKPRDHRAAQMQLEDFAKKVNKDILKDAGVSEEAWKKYLEAKRKQLTPPEKPRPETPSAPQQAKQLPNMGGRTIQPNASGQGDAHTPDRGKPPPGYRDSFREFTRQMSKTKLESHHK